MVAAVHDQIEAGTDVITDGEQTRLDFNLSFYGFLEGISRSLLRRDVGDPQRMISAESTLSSASSLPRTDSVL